ncbi:MAG: hypothetical protein Kow00121_40580 [Elainellaceae cyanobacterium]
MGARAINASLWKVIGRAGIVSLSIVLSGLWANKVEAQIPVLIVEDEDVIEVPTVQERVEDVFFTQDQTFYRNQRFPRTLVPIFGVIENDIGGDGRRVNELYRELLERQFGEDLLIRVADLPNPFTGSLATTPLYVEEPIPPAPIPSFQPAPSVSPAPRSQPVQPDEPIPALW